MGWTKLKLVLAGVLTVANVVLLCCILSLYRSTEYLPEDALQRVCLMLAEEGIGVTESAIDPRKPELAIREGELREDYYTRVAERLSGSLTELSFNSPNGFVMTMESGDRFSFQGNFGLRYEAFDAPAHRDLTSQPAGLSSLGAAEQKQLSRTVENFLRTAEPTAVDSYALFSKTLLSSGEDWESGIRYCTYAQSAQGNVIHDFILTFAVYENRVIAARGQWCFAQMDNAYSAQLMDQINILYSVRNRVLEEREAEGEEAAVTTVRALHLEYAAYFRTDPDRFYLIPVWRAELDGDKVYIINAINGMIYTN